MGWIESMCLPIRSFFCFLYKKQVHIFLHLGSAKNKQTSKTNHGGKTDTENTEEIREAASAIHILPSVIRLQPLHREHHVPDDLKRRQGVSWTEKRCREGYWWRKQSLGKGDSLVSCDGGLNKNAEQARIAPTQGHPCKNGGKRVLEGDTALPSPISLTDWLSPANHLWVCTRYVLQEDSICY